MIDPGVLDLAGTTARGVASRVRVGSHGITLWIRGTLSVHKKREGCAIPQTA